MKNLFAVTLITLTLAIGSFSFARSTTPSRQPDVVKAELLSFDVDPLLGLSQVNSGMIGVDLDKNELTLSLYSTSYCPPNVYCIMSIPAPYIVTLPIKSIGSTLCGGTVYVAERDMRPVDGALQRLVLVDNSANSVCMNSIDSQSLTEVTYATSYYHHFSVKEITTESHFTGGALQKEVLYSPQAN